MNELMVALTRTRLDESQKAESDKNIENSQEVKPKFRFV